MHVASQSDLSVPSRHLSFCIKMDGRSRSRLRSPHVPSLWEQHIVECLSSCNLDDIEAIASVLDSVQISPGMPIADASTLVQCMDPITSETKRLLGLMLLAPKLTGQVAEPCFCVAAHDIISAYCAVARTEKPLAHLQDAVRAHITQNLDILCPQPFSPPTPLTPVRMFAPESDTPHVKAEPQPVAPVGVPADFWDAALECQGFCQISQAAITFLSHVVRKATSLHVLARRKESAGIVHGRHDCLLAQRSRPCAVLAALH